MGQLDYSKLGFTLTVAEAASALGIEQYELRHLLLTGDLSGVLVSEGMFGPITVALHPDEVRDYMTARARGTLKVDSRNRSRALRLVHDYLAAHQPVDDYDRAMAENLPLLAVSGSETLVHVRAESLVEFHQKINVTGGSITTSMVAEALQRVGGARRKGVIAAADRGSRKQRWSVWWRVPSALLVSAPVEEAVRNLVGGSTEPGEKFRPARAAEDSGVYVDDAPLGS